MKICIALAQALQALSLYGRMGGIALALALATMVEDRGDMVVPYACMLALYGMR